LGVLVLRGEFNFRARRWVKPGEWPPEGTSQIKSRRLMPITSDYIGSVLCLADVVMNFEGVQHHEPRYCQLDSGLGMRDADQSKPRFIASLPWWLKQKPVLSKEKTWR
jgi:hypothetical protein